MRTLRQVMALLVFIGATGTCYGAVFKCADKQGRVELVDSKRPGCTEVKLPGQQRITIDRAQQLVQERLTDPASAQFKSLQQAKSGAVCGRVNSKNRMGGYNGFLGFVVSTYGFVLFEGENGFLDTFNENCS